MSPKPSIIHPSRIVPVKNMFLFTKDIIIRGYRDITEGVGDDEINNYCCRNGLTRVIPVDQGAAYPDF